MSRVRPTQPATPPAPRGVLCPYCGRISVNPRRCDACGGFFDPLSRQATQNAMGPWYLRDPAHPFRPGCSYETIRDMVKRGRIRPDTILRGPATRQFWNFAARTPTVANLLGLCHNCHATVDPDEYSCAACGAVFTPDTDRQHLGLAPVHLLPGQASPEIIASASVEHPARAKATGRGTAGRNATAARAAIEPERPRGRGLVRLLMTLGVLALLAGGGIGAWYLARALTETPPMVPASVPSPANQAPPPGLAAPAPEVPPNTSPSAAPSGGAGELTAKPADEPPAPKPAAAPQPAPTGTPAPEAPKASADPALTKLLTEGPWDDASVAAKIEAAKSAAPADAAKWEALIRARAEQMRVRGLR